MVEFNVLGPVTVTSGSDVLSVGGLKQRTVLSMLVSRAGKPLTADAIALAVYGDDMPGRARRSVQTYVSTLRSVVGDVIVKNGDAWTLRVDRAAVDATRLEDLYESAPDLSPDEASGVLREALALWRGVPYADVEAHGELDAEITRLVELRLSVLAARIDADLGSGRTGDLIGEIEALLVEYPYQERFRSQHMLALYRAGRQSEALRSFQELRSLLIDELGVDPSGELQVLEQRILEQDDMLLVGVDPLAHRHELKVESSGGLVDGDESTGVQPQQSLPSGVVTFLFTEVENSIRLWAADEDGMAASLRVHDDLLREAIGAHHGYVFTTAGNAFCVAFDRASDGVACAVAVQSELAGAEWPGPVLKVRMGLHLGEAEERGGDYFGSAVNVAARVGDAGHGGQILMSEAVRAASGADGLDLGDQRLRDVSGPVHLFQVGDGSFPALRVVPDTLSGLPIPATSLIGREAEILKVRTMLLEHRLVTLTGVGGCGKTRLAIEVAEQELPTLEHGAYFADLSSVSDDTGVVAAVAEAVRFDVVAGDPLERLVHHLVDKQVLVVLDNCEHVIDACADFAEVVLARHGDWRLLATSRELLDVDGEQVLQVPSLLAADGDAAIGLFETRASSVNSEFAVDDTNRSIIAELCERLDGMPLAIELAAARTVSMSPAEILGRIDDRFRVLSGGRRRSRERRRTLEATLDWSYDLLDVDEQALLTTLGVFRGSFGVAAAAAVGRTDADAATDVLESLVAKSLVITTTASGITLFRLLETVRAYAEERLQRDGELESARNRHLDHYVAAIDRIAGAAIAKHRDPTVWDWETVQFWTLFTPNLDAAIDWAIVCDRHPDAGELLVTASRVWREHLSTQPIIGRIDRVRAAIPNRSDLHDRLLIPRMYLVLKYDDRDDWLATAAEAIGVDNEAVRVHGFAFLTTAHVITDPGEALRLAGEGERINASDMWPLVRAYVHMFAGEVEQALAILSALVPQTSYLIDGTTAVLLLMDERPSEALDLAADHASTDALSGPFIAIVGLCQLAVGDRDAAERRFLADARMAALGRANFLSNSALVGLAALIHHDGDTEWAVEVILGSGMQGSMAIAAVARMVAEQIGVLDEFVKQQIAAIYEGAKGDATGFLRETLARWDAQQAAMADAP